eukprot:1160392-Pelagomonas_calceolata.AAC.1
MFVSLVIAPAQASCLIQGKACTGSKRGEIMHIQSQQERMIQAEVLVRMIILASPRIKSSG